MLQIPHLCNAIIMTLIHLTDFKRGLTDLMHKWDLSQYLNIVPPLEMTAAVTAKSPTDAQSNVKKEPIKGKTA